MGASTRWAYWEVDYSPGGLPISSSAQGWTNLVSQQAPIVDNTLPVISSPVYSPSNPTPADHVIIAFNVTDTGSLVKNATVYYTTDNWASVNQTVVASYNSTSYKATVSMPLFSALAPVKFYLMAWDNAGNSAKNDNSGSYYTFSIGSAPILSEPWFWVLVALALVALVVIFAVTRRRKKPSPAQTSS